MLGRHTNGWQLGDLRRELDRLFTDFFQPARGLASGLVGAGGYPALNLWEDESSFHAEAELPGLKLEDLEIHVLGNQLVIKGERKPEAAAGATQHRSERPTGPFGRVVRLPAEVNAEKVEASLKDGLLHVSLPKAEAAKPRKVKVVSA